MRPKTALYQLGKLLKAQSFNSRQAATLGVNASTLAHYAKQGDLERVGRGVYRAKDAPEVEDFRWEDLMTAFQSTKDGVICLTSALAIYQLTEEIPRQHWIAVKNTTRHRTSPSTKVIRMRNVELGRTEIKMNGMVLPIFDRERTIVDAFRYLGLEAALKALKIAVTLHGSEKIDLDKMRRYSHTLRVKIEPYLLAVSV
jgi:predicted transcriptional regulator of viral defense system